MHCELNDDSNDIVFIKILEHHKLTDHLQILDVYQHHLQHLQSLYYVFLFVHCMLQAFVCVALHHTFC